MTMTNPTTADFRGSRNRPSPATAAQKVVIVNGSAEILELFDTVLEAGHYDVIFVESSNHAYSQIKRVRPDLVILCIRMDEAESVQVLSMLKLDPETREIPMLTYTADGEPEQSEAGMAEPSDAEIFSPKPALWMN